MKHTEETKIKLSNIQKNYLKNNPDKHPWKRENRKISAPCELVKSFLHSKCIHFVEEWQPLDDRFYSIDIAFPDIKLGIEINGNQHYDSIGKLKPYYQKRHDLITNAGWNLLELHYSIAYNLDKLNEILSIKEQPDYSDYFIEKEKRQFKKKSRLSKKDRANAVRIKTNKRWETYILLIETSNIDFTKFGWVKDVSTILGITPQSVKRWMLRHMPEFYESNCYKRKLTQVTGEFSA